MLLEDNNREQIQYIYLRHQARLESVYLTPQGPFVEQKRHPINYYYANHGKKTKNAKINLIKNYKFQKKNT